MASLNFKTYDRTLRRFHMLRLVEAMEDRRGLGFRASLVVHPRTGKPLPLAEAPAHHPETRAGII
jgi:hypothetical protein